MLEVRDLHKYYGAFHAVRGISFDVAKGEIVGFLGPNGAGKTTTMKIAVGFMTMSSGTITVDQRDVVKDSMAVRRVIGYLPEHAPLYEDMTVTEYLSFIADVRGLRGAQRAERLKYVLGVCALEPKRRSGIKTLSKGYRQRVGLAQAIIHDPKLVILDEPTVGLDPNQIIEIRNLIREIGERNTVVLSSHILAEVEATCSRVVIINEGLIVANGTPSALGAALTDDNIVQIELGADLSDAKSTFADHVDVAEVLVAETTHRGCTITIRVTESCTSTKPMIELSAENGWEIHGIVRPNVTLEDVFKSLTNSGGAPQKSLVMAHVSEPDVGAQAETEDADLGDKS